MQRKLLMILAFFGSCVSAVMFLHAAAPGMKPPPRVLSVREFDLKAGVKAADFEAFVRRELSGALGPEAAGMKLQILKGDRGGRKGRYVLVWEFDSTAARDRCFPHEGGGSSAAFEPTWNRLKTIMEKFGGYVKEQAGYTDYVQVSD